MLCWPKKDFFSGNLAIWIVLVLENVLLTLEEGIKTVF